jgi:hypothetical protein
VKPFDFAFFQGNCADFVVQSNNHLKPKTLMTPFVGAGTGAGFKDNMKAFQADIIKSLVNKTISDVKVVDNIPDRKGTPRTGLVLTVDGKDYALMSWDIRATTLSTFPTKDKVVFERLEDVLHTASEQAFASCGGDEKKWLEGVAAAIKGKKCGVKLYPAQSLKGGSYQGCVFIVE